MALLLFTLYITVGFIVLQAHGGTDGDENTMEQNGGDTGLYYLTYCCYGLSGTALTVAIVMFMTFREWSSERYLIHINFALSQLSAQIFFLVGQTQVTNKIECRVFSICTHLTFLSVFFWLLVEAVDLFFKMILRFDRERSKLPFFMFLGWGAPVAIVIICAGNNLDQYGSDNSCWLEAGNSLVWAFIVPASAIILISTVLLFFTAREYLSHTPNSKTDSEKDIMIRETDWVILRGIFGSTSILAATWLYGFLLVSSPTSPMFQYSFVLSNGAHGVIFYILFCFLNKEVRLSWQPPPPKKPTVVPLKPKKPEEPKKVDEVKPVDPPKTVEEKTAEAKVAMWKAFDDMINLDETSEASLKDDEPQDEEITEEKKEARKAMWGKFDLLLDVIND